MTEKIIEALNDGILEIGKSKIPCSVLDGEIRVLTQEGFLNAIGRAGKAKAGTGAETMVDRLPAFLSARNLKPFISAELEQSTKAIRFKTTKGSLAYGYRAELLPQVCEVYLKARDEKKLTIKQKHIAIQADILMRGLAHVGIIALVDEATGYQASRARKALEKILEQFISKELQKWVKTFPDEFYEEIFRLKNWSYNPATIKRPSVIGKYTNDIVYYRLAPKVLEELQQRTPKNPQGNRRYRYFQWLTMDIGHPRLKEHLAAVIALMKASNNWNQFYRAIQRALPSYRKTADLELLDHEGDPI